jgi:SH3-like domain-containing protein
MRKAILLFAIWGATAAAAAEAPPAFVPHYMSQRGTQADLREGPSYDHKVLWVYRHRGYPFRALAGFDIWRRVEAADGTIGWMSVSMLSDNRTVLVTGKGRAQIRQGADPTSKVTGLADPGAILGLKMCARDFCRIAANGIDGWIAKDRIWGVEANEISK